MDHHYGNPVHMAALSMQSHQQPNCQQHYSHQGGQYQHFYNDYADVCYQSPGYHDGGFSGEQYGYHPTASVPYGTGIESYLDPKYAANPAAFASRLPYLPFHAAAVAAYGMYDYSFEPAFIRKRNERERQRVKCVNEGYARLREHLPEEYAEKRLSKVETLRGAIVYIKQLQTLLGFDPEKRAKAKKNEKAKSDEQEKKKSEDEKKATDNSSDNDTQNQNGDKEYSHTQNKNNNQLQSCVYNEQNLADDGIKMESPIQTKDGENEQSYDNEDALLSSCVNARYRSCMKNQQNETFNKASSGANSADTLQFQVPRNNLLSPFDCQVEENKRKNLSDQNPCYHKNNFISSPNTDFNANIVSWTQSASKQNPLYNEFPNKSYSRKISCAKTNTVDPFDDMFQNSRHHPYKRFASMSDSPPEHHWVNGIRVKSETHTPPPYVRYDFPDHQDNVLYPPYRYNYSGSFHHTTFNMNQSGRGGQSDGFKSDTSPESSAGQSP